MSSERNLSPPPQKDISSSLRVPHSPPPKGDAPGVGASGVRSRSGGMSFTVNSTVSSRCFHASGNDENTEEELNHQHDDTSRNKSNSSSSSSSSTKSLNEISSNDIEETNDLNHDVEGNNCSIDQQPSREKLWSYSLRNVNRAVDELYYLCEAEDNLVYCEEARELFLKCSRDFDKLIERSEAQSQYEASLKDQEGVNSIPSGIAWEVRKTANASPPLCRISSNSNSNSFDNGSNQTNERGEIKKQASMGEHVIRHAIETMEQKARLERASSFTATSISSESTGKHEEVSVPKSPSPPLPPPPQCEVEPAVCDELTVFATKGNESTSELIANPPVAPKVRHGDFHSTSSTKQRNVDTSSDVGSQPLSARERRNRRRQEASVAASSTSSSAPSSLLSAALAAKRIPSPAPVLVPPPPLPAAKPKTDSDMNEDEDILATEKVWAEAEAWVEAEAAAEELAWQRLHSGNVPLTTLEADDKAREANSLARGSPAEWLLGASEGKASSAESTSHQQTSVKQAQVELEQEDEDEIMEFGDDDVPPPPTSTRSVHGMSSAVVIDTPTTPPSSLNNGFGTTSSRSALKRSGSGSEKDALLIGRAMNAKLSSPTRMKPSAEVTNAKAEMRHDKAQKNRELLETNRRMRVGEAAERAKQVKGRVESQQSAIEESHYSKLSAGEERHAQHIAAIRVKAENENIKVEEVLFINGLTAAGIKKSLDDRLREIEKRMELGRLRKAEEMEAKKEQSRRREKMVSLRLRNNEQLAGERWLKLQTLIEDVGRRRKERLDEIARRRSATTSTTSVDLSTAPPPSETTTTNLDALSIKPFAASESLPSTPLPTPPRHRSKSFSFPDEKCRPFVPSSPSKKQQEVTTHDVDMRKASSLDERRSSKESSTTSIILPTQPTNNNKPMISNNQKNNSTNGLKTNSRAQQLMASPPRKSSSYHEPSSSSSAPLFGSLAVVSAAEQHHSQKPQNNGKGVNRDSKKRFGDREGAVRSAGLDDGASVFTPNAEPIVNPKSKSPSPARSPPRAQSSSITSPSLINTGGVPPNPMGKPFKRKGSGAPDNPGSFNEKWSRGSGKKSGMKNTQSFDEKSKPKNDDEDEGGGGSANRGKKLRKLRTKLLRLAPGWSESRWGSTQSQDSWNTPVTSHQDHGSSGGGGNLVTEPVPVLNDSLRMRLDRCVEKLRKFRDSSYGGGKGGQKSPALKAVNSHQSSSGVSEIETSLHDLGRLLSDLSMGVGASTSAQSAAVQRRIRESGGLELLQQLTAPRHGVFNSTAAPLAMDALSHCFACQATQRDFVLAVDAGVGVVDAATYALELVMNTENSLVPQLTRQSNESSSNHFGTTTGSNRSLASLSAMVERTNPHPAPSRPSSSIKTEPSSVSNSSSVNPWEMLNTTILLLMHLLRHSAAPGLEVAQESMVRFLCVTGFLQDLVSLLIGSRAGNWTSIASIAIGESTQSSSSSSLLGSDRRYQLLTNVEARTLLRRSLALLEAVAAFPLVLTNEGEDMMKPKDGSVVSPSMLVCQTMSNVSTVNVDAGRAASGVRRLLEDTNAAGVFTILTEIVRYNTPPTTTDLTVHQNKSISSVASIKLSDECLELCISSLSCLNNIARLNLELFQKVLIPNKVLSVCNILFNSVNTNTNNSRMSRISKYLLSELIIFVGFFVLDEPSNQILLLEDLSHLNHTNSKPQQQLVSSRRKKTIDDLEDEEQLNINTTSSSTTTVSEEKDDEHILHYLMSLPREKLSDQNELYPTLLAASHKNDSIQQYLGEEFMDELKTYIETNTEAMNQSSSEAANVSGGDIKKSNSSSPPSSTLRIEVVPDGSAYPFWVALSHRFPIEFWMGKGGLVANSAIDRCTEAV